LGLSKSSTALALACASACATAPPPHPRPPVVLTADHFVGTIHTGALADPAPADRGEPWWFELRLAYTESAPPEASEPVSALARQVFVESGDEPLRSRSQLALGVLRAPDSGLRTAAPAPEGPEGSLARVEPVWTGTTTAWRATRDGGTEDPPRASWASLELEVTRPADPEAPPELALVLESDSAVREHLVLDAPPGSAGPALLLFLPAARTRSPSGGFLLELARVEAPAGASADESIERASASLERSTARAREGTGGLTREEGFHFESSSALRALEDRSLHRSALAFLAQATGANLTGELAIVAGEPALESYLDSLSQRVRDADLDASESEALGWKLESVACAWLAARSADEQHPLEPELRALLLVHAGELARFPDLLGETVGECDSLAGFANRLLDENRIFLEDADPSARLRAFEWLRARGAAPEGFDPLAPLPERRAALDRAREEEAEGQDPGAGGGR